jgi:hypothetical protein
MKSSRVELKRIRKRAAWPVEVEVKRWRRGRLAGQGSKQEQGYLSM